MYEVIGAVQSRTFRVLWMLEELGQTYTHLPEETHSELVMRLNPSGKIPVMREGNEVLTDSTAIITYLADKHGQLTHPAGTLARAHQDGLTQLVLDEIDAVLWTAARHSFALPKERRVPEVKDSLRWEFGRNVARISDRLEGPFLMGDMMTVPDIIFAHCLNWAYASKFLYEQENLLAYAKAMRGRDAFKRALGT
jgi:glutathione S-transferase